MLQQMQEPASGMASRPVYRHADLKRAFHPDSIAIVGASERAGSFGERLLANLSGYDGRIHLVNPRYPRLGDRTCYPSLSDLPEVPDCAIIVTNRDSVEVSVAECVRLGVGGMIVYASGFVETGRPEYIALQDRIANIVRGTGSRLIGPNCVGIYNFLRQARMVFSPAPDSPPPTMHAIGIASQSGALGTALAQAIERGVSVSHMLTTGNSADVDIADLVSYLADDPGCKAIACLFEGLRDPKRMIEAANIAWKGGKPLIVYKMAKGQKGAAAAMSHTGSLAGENASYAAAFERCGVIEVDSIDDLVEFSSFFAKVPQQPKAAGVAVVSTSGGSAIMAADKAEAHGVALPELMPETEALLRDLIPEYGSAKNPCDVTGDILNNPDSLRACAEVLYSEESVGTLLYPHNLAYPTSAGRFEIFAKVAEKHGKAFCAVWVSEWLQGPGTVEAERNPNVALFYSMDRCFRALSAWHMIAAKRAAGGTRRARQISDEQRRAAAKALGTAEGLTLTEREAKNILRGYDLPFVPDRLVQSAKDAASASVELGFPVVLKVESPEIPHKSDAGLVKLNLRTEDEVIAAFADIARKTRSIVPAPTFNGVVVQPMMKGGIEIVVGGRIDPLFGPIVLVGLGGVMVEVLKDTAVSMAPVSTAEAGVMLRSLKGFQMLTGFRGAEPVDLDELAAIVGRVSEFLADFADEIAELDINPLICSAEQIVAVDALIVKRGS